jgi:hypothetical protein
LAAVQRDESWPSQDHIDLSRAIISLVPLSEQTEAKCHYGAAFGAQNGTSVLKTA